MPSSPYVGCSRLTLSFIHVTTAACLVPDFGVATLLDPGLTAAGETLGNPAYMAPEQALHGTAGPRSDLYLLGCVLHELLAGQQLFTAEVPYALIHKHVEQAPQPLRQLRPDVPVAVERLVLDLLAKEPEQRPADALAVHQRLLPFLPQPGSGSSSAPVPMDPTRPYRYPLDPRRCVDIRSPAEVTTQVAADVDGARRHAQRLIDEGRFTQAAEILAEAVAAQTRHGDAERVQELRLGLASALIPGSDYRRALPECQTLIAELTETRDAADEIVLHCRNQAAICAAEIGDVSTALRDFRSLLADQQRALGSDHDQVLELRRQVGLLEVSSGDVSSARQTLGALERDLHRLRGPRYPDALELGALLAHLRQLGSRGGCDEAGPTGRSRRL